MNGKRDLGSVRWREIWALLHVGGRRRDSLEAVQRLAPMKFSVQPSVFSAQMFASAQLTKQMMKMCTLPVLSFWKDLAHYLPFRGGKRSHFGLITRWLTVIHFFFCFTLHFCHLFSTPSLSLHLSLTLWVSWCVCVCVDGWVDVFVGRIEEAKLFKNHSNMPLNEWADSKRRRKCCM